MRVLAIDTAMGGIAACVLDASAPDPLSIESRLMQRGHAEQLIPLLARVIAPAEKRIDSISRIIVTIGPGSFTGMRVGISAARAMARVYDIPVAGVSTLAALAAPVIGVSKAHCIASVIDAKHGYFYFQLVAITGKLLVSPTKISEADLYRLFGNELTDLVGHFDLSLVDRLRARGLRLANVRIVAAPDIVQVARLGMLCQPAEAIVKPMYMAAADVKAPASPSNSTMLSKVVQPG